ncbi:hypothetical protein BGX27_009346 [Mortierella sp. AM989]|nr:hypothetical protein BGX27_009346 [Mortierella sp. AM989]
MNTNTNIETIESISSLNSTPTVAFAQESKLQDVTPLSEVKKVSDALTDDEADTETKNKKTKRNSLVAFVDSFRSPKDGTIPIDRTTTQNSVASAKSTSSRRSFKTRPLSWVRRSSVEEQEDNAPYADVVRAQNEFMEKLRAEQEKSGITHNADGIPIPRRSSRRSSVIQILGLDKPLLAF